MEFPDTKQYTADPLVTHHTDYQGLQVVDVGARFSTLLWTGFVFEVLILGLVLANLAMGNRFLIASNLLGYLSFLWFVWLLFYRFDHYGKVCSGDYASDKESAAEVEAVSAVGRFLKKLTEIVGYSVLSLFSVVFIYTCCNDSRKE